jgi:DNA invertase Pin-like site-specific DNA recombinase
MKVFLIADLYMRVASRLQADIINGMQRQDSALREFCEIHGIVIRNVYQDTCSGKEDGPQWMKYQEEISQDPDGADILLVSSYDRLSRDFSRSMEKQEYLRSIGVKVVRVERDPDWA